MVHLQSVKIFNHFRVCWSCSDMKTLECEWTDVLLFLCFSVAGSSGLTSGRPAGCTAPFFWPVVATASVAEKLLSGPTSKRHTPSICN